MHLMYHCMSSYGISPVVLGHAQQNVQTIHPVVAGDKPLLDDVYLV